jgi:hypothetical protein
MHEADRPELLFASGGEIAGPDVLDHAMVERRGEVLRAANGAPGPQRQNSQKDLVVFPEDVVSCRLGPQAQLQSHQVHAREFQTDEVRNLISDLIEQFGHW